jgi:uncharacterized protein (TIGR02594 family)
MAEPRWLVQARTYIGLEETPGPQHQPAITKWLDRLKAPFRDDETAWCGTFVGGVFDEVGIKPVASPWGARQWLKFGQPVPKPTKGAVVVFWRGKPDGWSGHVGFVVGKDKAGNIMVLGGNQGDAVNIKPFATNRVLGYRWPLGESIPPATLPLLNSDGKVSKNES